MVKYFFQSFYHKLENSTILRCIRKSLVMLIPIILVGSFCIILQSLPIQSYQIFLKSYSDGFLIKILNNIFFATTGLSSLYLTISLAISYMQTTENGYDYNDFGLVFTALICFGIWSGVANGSNFQISFLGNAGILTALFCGLGASILYSKISNSFKQVKRSLADGVDLHFHRMFYSVFPMLIVVNIFLLFYLLMTEMLHYQSFTELFSELSIKLFEPLGCTFSSAILYELILNLLWFFGIHGGDVLEQVTQNLFYLSAEINAPFFSIDVFNGSFLNVFVAMGGCGTVLCLLLSILIFSKRRNNRRLAQFSLIPTFFNISEVIILGLPVVFNPVFFIPFILTPIAMVCTTAISMYIGFVPPAEYAISWTTPAILSGYMATKSINGSILQIINILLGILIYAPFVKLYDHMCMRDSEYKLEKLITTLKKSEENHTHIELLSLNNNSCLIAKILSEELKYNMSQSLPTLYYQPQYNSKGNCIGVEALLRWFHPNYGLIYPPLVIKLIEESGMLLELEKDVIRSVLKDSKRLFKILPENAEISLNITGSTIQSKDFHEFLIELQKAEPDFCKRLMIEITEQAALNLDDSFIERMIDLKEHGFRFAIDDFSMGSTSIKYLQTNIFSLIKLDGGISKNITENERSREIISSLSDMALKMNATIIAEFVETNAQRELLEQMGCLKYQGYLYSPALSIERLEKHLQK